jgi:hypothetical protein
MKEREGDFMDNLKIWTYIGITSIENPLDYKFVLVSHCCTAFTKKKQNSVHTAQGQMESMSPIVNKQLSCEMGLDFYCKFKQNQETTKIAFVSFQFLKLFQAKSAP